MSSPPPSPTPRVVLYDHTRRVWTAFTSPRRIIATHRLDEVIPLLRDIDETVERDGLFAAGFLSYEAAPAFDPALTVRPDGAFPLLWFGLFDAPVEIPPPAQTVSHPPIDWRPSVTEADYHRAIHAIRDYIREGDTYQVNYTYRLRATTDEDPWDIFARMAGDGEAPYAAFVDTGTWAIASASPEMFLDRDGIRVESRPMKGTAPRGLWWEDDEARRVSLLTSAKDRAENVMITDMVRNDLGRIARMGSVQVSDLVAAERYPTVWQTTSTVRAETDASLDRLIGATFPPASITGAPKCRTMGIIAELESTPRRIYTGAIGLVAPGRKTRFNVAIRTVLVHRPTKEAEYGVGGGIVWDSTPEGEYAESLTKARILTHRPPDFDLLETLRWSPAEGFRILDRHLERLLGSAAYFGFAVDEARVREALLTVASRFPPTMQRVRVIVSRSGVVRCEAAPLDPANLHFGDIVLATRPVDRSDIFLYHKTTNRSVYDAIRRDHPGCADVLLANEEGEITESTMANVAIERDGVLITPPLQCGLLAGTERACLLAAGRLREGVIHIEDLRDQPTIYLLNSVRGMHPVRVVDAMV